MTEDEWLQSFDVEQRLQHLGSRASERKLRLLAVASCRLRDEVVKSPLLQKGLAVVERYADRLATDDELVASLREVGAEYVGVGPESPDDEGEFRALMRENEMNRAVQLSGQIPTAEWPLDEGVGWAIIMAHNCYDSAPLLLDIFGNPFHPVAADPNWLSPAAVSLARGIYDDKAFDRLPILADALQDAGCDNPDVLAHCREPGPHARGCWVVDLVLGRE